MPQTIAMQRGTSTVASGGSATTLWTQSGGTATRVIFNGMAFHTGTTNVFGSFSISVVPSGGAPYVICRGSVDRSSWQVTPSNEAYAMISVASTNYFPNTTLFRINDSSVYPANSTSPNGVTYAPDANNQGTGMPSNFWIGPSDSIIIRYVNNNNLTATFGWSFTTITES